MGKAPVASAFILILSSQWLVLDRRPGGGWLGMTNPATLFNNKNMRVAVAGQSSDLNRGSQITMDWGCRAWFSKGVLNDLCRSWKGASGSPVIAVDGHAGRRMVIGVNAAHSSVDIHGNPTIGGVSESVHFAAASPEMFAMYVKLRAALKVFEK